MKPSPSRKYDKLPNIVIYACKKTEQMCGPQIRLCLFKFLSIASKQLNSLTTIARLTLLSRGKASALSARGPGFNSRLWQGFLGLIFLCLLLYFYILSKTRFLSQSFAIPFAMLIYLVLYVYLTYLARCVAD